MKTLNLHVDYIEWKGLKKALKNIEDYPKQDISKKRVEEALAVLIAVEKNDSLISVQELIRNITEISEQVKTKNIVLYPYAHLSKNLGSPKIAIEILEETEKELKKQKFKVTRAPFGYYKTFEMKVKGHPLSELSREIGCSCHERKKEELIQSYNEEEISESERKRLWKIMSKNKIQSIRGKNNLKSNVEIGKELDLYIINGVVGPGLPLLTPKGTTIKREIERFIVDEEIKRGYEHTSTPIIAKSDLYKISGHWQHYKKDMFTLEIEGKDYALRPMTCPFQFVLYKRKPRTYKDLPKKYAEIATLYRKEKSGELRGLTRLWQFTLADGHIICAPNQLEEQFREVMDLLEEIMRIFKIEVWYRFSKWDPKNKDNKYVNEPKAWEETQKSMKKILDNMKLKYIEAEDEAAFYGPKLDLQYKDVYGKEDTLITIQIDFSNAKKFGMTYKDKKGKEKVPMIIHRSSTGATERIISYLLEKNQGSLPLWLSPTQVKILTIDQKNEKYAEKIYSKLKSEGIRIEKDFSNETISKKVKKSYLKKVYYIVTIGGNEEKNKNLSIKERGKKETTKMKLEEFIEKIKKEIKERK